LIPGLYRFGYKSYTPAWDIVALRRTHNRNSRQLLNKAGCATHMSHLIDSRDQFIGQLLARFGKLDFLCQQWRTRHAAYGGRPAPARPWSASTGAASPTGGTSLAGQSGLSRHFRSTTWSENSARRTECLASTDHCTTDTACHVSYVNPSVCLSVNLANTEQNTVTLQVC